jgi:hypothetical protein
LDLQTDVISAARHSLFRDVDFAKVNSNDELRIGTVGCSIPGGDIGIAFDIQNHFINPLSLPPNPLFILYQDFII